LGSNLDYSPDSLNYHAPQQELLDIFRRTLGSTKGPRVAIMTRALRAFDEMVSSMNARAMEQALDERSDMATVMHVLMKYTARDIRLGKKEPQNGREKKAEETLALLRGVKSARKMLNEKGKALATSEAAELLQVSRQAVNKARNKGHLLGVRIGNRFLFPAWQFTGTGNVLPGLVEVLQALGDIDPWMKLRFFLRGNKRLKGATALDYLLKGRKQEVLDAARLEAGHGAF